MENSASNLKKKIEKDTIINNGGTTLVVVDSTNTVLNHFQSTFTYSRGRGNADDNSYFKGKETKGWLQR